MKATPTGWLPHCSSAPLQFRGLEPKRAGSGGHVSRPGTAPADQRPRTGMLERQPPGMQALPLQARQGLASVENISKQGMPQVPHVDANLMRAPGVQSTVHQTSLLLTGQNAQIGTRRLTRLPRRIDNGHAGALVGISAYGLLDRRLGRSPPGFMSQGQILALYLSARNRTHQRLHGGAGLGHHHEAAGVLVEPVNNAGPWQQPSPFMMRKQAIEQRATPMARRRMDHQTHPFVENQQISILVQHSQIHGLGIKGAGLSRQITTQLNLVAQPDLGRRAGLHPTVHLHRRDIDELLNKIAREIGQHQGQSLIEPLPVSDLGHPDLARQQGGRRIPDAFLEIVIPVRRHVGSYNFRITVSSAHHRFNAKVHGMLFAGLSTARIVPLIAALPLILAGCASEPKDPTAGWSPNKIYTEAREEAASGAYDKAVSLFEKLEGRAAGTALAQQAQLEKAHAHYRAGEPAQAIATLDRFMRLHPTSPAVDYALYLKGLANFNDNLGLFGRLARKDLSESDQKAAKESFESFKELVTRFPDSKYAADARLRMTYVVNSVAQSEVNVARYYHSRGAYIAAINRAQTALNEFRDVPAHEEALFILYRSYDALGMTSLRDDTLRVMQRTYPNSAYLGGANPATSKRPWYRFW